MVGYTRQETDQFLLNHGAVSERHGASSAGNEKRGSKSSLLLRVVSTVCVALLAVVIWLAVEYNKQAGQIAAIQQSLLLGAATTTAPARELAASAIVSTYPSVYLSQSATPPAGEPY